MRSCRKDPMAACRTTGSSGWPRPSWPDVAVCGGGLTPSPLVIRRVATSMIALAHCWPGPTESAMARRIAVWESEKTVCLRPECCLASKILRAWCS